MEMSATSEDCITRDTNVPAIRLDALRLPDEAQVLTAARTKADNPMSDADAFAVALALESDTEVWTGDPEILVENAPWRWRDLRQ